MTPSPILCAHLATTLAAVTFAHEDGGSHTAESGPSGRLGPRSRKQARGQVRQGNTDLTLAAKPTFLPNQQPFRAL